MTTADQVTFSRCDPIKCPVCDNHLGQYCDLDLIDGATTGRKCDKCSAELVITASVLIEYTLEVIEWI